MFNGSSGADYQDTKIINDGFWPDINAGDFEKRRGVPAHMDKEAIAYAVAAAIAQLNIELNTTKEQYQKSGFAKASSVTGQPSIGEKNLLVILYEKAVYARAKADLLPEFATQQTKEAGDRVAEKESDTKESLLAESQQHVRAMKGKGRVGVELI
ncbi:MULTISPECIES: head completion/stabilization protein [Vibrio]|uniref:Head completion/stabilization protein n=1 Tax=Vibrio tasmaniensis TaxID=212663 RepID=A0A2N7NH38_9VIBR|nr:head completion/stabilization protein [Vibrio tasmaniensis]PMP13760.1 head protein [Vibrio tasmaniensis]TKG28474.1 head completion/stabilization protein [Vibrio tasmaniensis]TKG39076.1 head completion/stabilization protein [Vibrio tasmaniensis]TKG42325.1 head completion/stabilization protein [Vibrio tasmaniensis]TKG54910.1 head completion/stabilization protein [Vibrio tasmaniensis]